MQSICFALARLVRIGAHNYCARGADAAPHQGGIQETNSPRQLPCSCISAALWPKQPKHAANNPSGSNQNQHFTTTALQTYVSTHNNGSLISVNAPPSCLCKIACAAYCFTHVATQIVVELLGVSTLSMAGAISKIARPPAATKLCFRLVSLHLLRLLSWSMKGSRVVQPGQGTKLRLFVILASYKRRTINHSQNEYGNTCHGVKWMICLLSK